MAPRGTIWGSICIVVTLSDIETIWTKFGQNPGFSLRNSVSLTPGPTVKDSVIGELSSRIGKPIPDFNKNKRGKEKTKDFCYYH